MALPLRILIIGTSIAGPTLATFLLLSNLTPPPHITILERAHSLRTTGQNIDIRGAGISILEKLGVLAAVRANTTNEAGVQLVDAANNVWATVDADRSGKYSTPTADIEILRGRLAEVLVGRMRDVSEDVVAKGGRGIEEIWGDQVAEIEQDDREEIVRVRFAETGQWREFDIVVGADGLQSSTRKLAWGANQDGMRVKRLGMYGAFFSMPKGKTDSEYRRWFHAPGRRGIMVRPDDTGSRTTVFMHVISNTDDRLAATAGKENMDAQKALMNEYFADAGWESKRILDAMMVTDDFYYDLIGQVKMDRWSKGRVVLVGDAGYCASALSGMGTTLALSGAYNLAGALTQHAGDVEAAFTQYENIMRPAVKTAQKLAPGMPYLINPETVWGVYILNMMAYLITASGLIQILFKLGLGPPAHKVRVEEYGFRQSPASKELRRSTTG